MSLFQDLKLKRRKTSSVSAETSRSTSTAPAASSYVQSSSSAANSPNSSNNSNSPTLLNQLLLQRTHSPGFEKAQQPVQQPQQIAGNNLVFATGSNVIVANTKRTTESKKATALNGQTCAVITCSGSAGKGAASKIANNNKSVIQQYRSNSFSSSNSSLSPSSSPPTALLSGAQSIAPSQPYHSATSAVSKLNPAKLVSANNSHCFNHGILQHSQSINSSGNSSPPSASSSSCSPPPSTSSAVSLFEIDSDQCLDLSSNTLTTSTSNPHHPNHSKQTIIAKPFIAHQTIIKLQPSTELNSKCSSSEHNYQLQQTAKNRCSTASSTEQMLLINASSTGNSGIQSDLSSSKTTGGPLSSLNNSHNPNSLRNSFRQAKGQTFMLATEHIPSTFNQLSHSTNTVTNSTSAASNCKSNTPNGSPKTMLWTLVNPGSLVNANHSVPILFATIPNSASSANGGKPENSKLTATSQSSIVQCIKPTTLANTVSKPITNAILTSAPVLKYTFVAPSSSLNSANDENDSKGNNASNSVTSCIASTNASSNVSSLPIRSESSLKLTLVSISFLRPTHPV